MTLSEARRKVWAYRLIGWSFVVVGLIAGILFFGKMHIPPDLVVTPPSLRD
jgi:hypothetical protein